MGNREKKKPSSEMKITIQTICAVVGTLIAIIEFILNQLKG